MNISFVIPVKNEEDNIQRCLASIVAQDFNDSLFEIIVIDNGSSDSTVDCSKRYTDSVYVQPGISISEMRNFGVKHAQFDFIAFIDADMELLENWFLRVAETFSMSTNVVGVGARPVLPEASTWVERGWYSQIEALPEIYERGWLASMNMVVTKDSFVSIGGFDVSLLTCEDVDLGIRLSKVGSLINNQEIKAVHHGGIKCINSLVKKELWRGSYSIRGVISHGVTLSELPSLGIPLLCILFTVLFILSAVQGHMLLSVISIISVILLISIKPLYIILKKRNIRNIYSIFAVWYIYYVVRSFSMIRELLIISCSTLIKCKE